MYFWIGIGLLSFGIIFFLMGVNMFVMTHEFDKIDQTALFNPTGAQFHIYDTAWYYFELGSVIMTSGILLLIWLKRR